MLYDKSEIPIFFFKAYRCVGSPEIRSITQHNVFPHFLDVAYNIN